MVNGRKILTIVTKNSTLDVPRFLWRRAYIRDVNWVTYLLGAYIQGVLMYKGHINGILRDFHLELKLFFFFFEDSSINIDMVVRIFSFVSS